MATAPWNRSPMAAALWGGLCLLPFAAANAIVANRIEPWFSIIRPGPHTSPQEYVVLAGAIAAIAVGAFIAARPLFSRAAPSTSRLLLLNAAVGAGMLVIFLVLLFAVGGEIYRCDVLGIPNCD